MVKTNEAERKSESKYAKKITELMENFELISDKVGKNVWKSICKRIILRHRLKMRKRKIVSPQSRYISVLLEDWERVKMAAVTETENSQIEDK